MRMKREGGRGGSLVELGKEGENCRQIIQQGSHMALCRALFGSL